ncbi:MAG: DUF2207 domain-containing protein [bacterium]|nr:DUF2207 domain-containing protein [bacterium]
MKKLIFILVVTILSFGGVFHQTAFADANDFVVKKFEADYYLSKDSENRSILKVIEEITVEFPDFDQNHGIERALPKKYQGHDSFLGGLKVLRNGEQEGVSSSDENGNIVFRIGKADEYVRGEQKYRIEYSYRDVIRDDLKTKNSNAKEQFFIWNTNGTQWRQNFRNLIARVHIPKELSSKYTGLSCYFGEEGSKEKCPTAEKSEESDGSIALTFGASSLSVGQNVTFSITLKPDTFVGYQEPFWVKYIGFSLWIVSAIEVAITVYLIHLSLTRFRSVKTGDPIVPQYLPPNDISLFESAVLTKANSKVIAAMIIKMAINGNIKIIERDSKGVFSRGKEYILRKINNNGLIGNESITFNKIFKSNKTEVKISSLRTDFFNDFPYYAEKVMKDDRFYSSISRTDVGIVLLLSMLVLLGVLYTTGAFEGIMDRYIGSLAILAILSIVNTVYSMILLSLHPLNMSGAKYKDYLDGLKLYMKLAEADRIKILQSVKGAERLEEIGESRVKLYERLLPYAILFGIEKSWLHVLSIEYGNAAPSWYDGTTAFNAAVFAQSISSISSSVNSYTDTSSSSSGGGGEFSGGGGGGGGGGGW